MKAIKHILPCTLFLVVWLMPFQVYSQKKIDICQAYRNPEQYRKDSAMARSYLIFNKENIGLRSEGYSVRDPAYNLSSQDFALAVWLITKGDYLYLNSKRHGFRNQYIKLKKHGNYYFFSAQPILSINQTERVINAYHYAELLGVALAYRKMNYHNAKKRDHVLDLENGITTPFSADYLFKLLNDYPVLKYEFINDTTTLDRDRLLYYLDKINYEWQSRQETTNNTEL